MDLELTGKRALVTGGSRGIGKAIARELAREGADVAIAARDQARIDATVAELAGESGRRVVGRSVDTRDGESVAAMVQACADALGGIDILVNAAAQPGGQQPAPRWDAVTEEALFEEIRVKVLGYLRVAQAAVPHMIASRWGRIINVGRMIDVREVAYVVTFLASPKSIAIDGDTIAAGGGVPGAIYY